jgi:excisionase family DNA binding protein
MTIERFSPASIAVPASDPARSSGTQQASPDGDRLLNVHEAAAYLGLAAGTLYHQVSQGRVPCVRLSARCLRFRLSDLRRFIDSKVVRASAKESRSGAIL